MERNTLAQEYLGMITAARAAQTTDRNDAALTLALSAIGTIAPIILVLQEGTVGEFWTFNADQVFPRTATVWIPPGVFVNGTGNLHFEGQLFAWHDDWYQGSGQVTFEDPLGVLFHLNGLSAQELRAMTRYTLGANLEIRTTRVIPLDAANNEATLEATGVLTLGSRIHAILHQVVTSFGTSHGLTGFAIGDRWDSILTATRWGSGFLLTAGSASNAAQFASSVEPIVQGDAAGDIVVTSLGGAFDATGRLILTVVSSTYNPASSL